MAYAPKSFYNAALSATITATLYTNPGGVTSIIKDIEICNTGSSTRAVTIAVRGSGAGHRILSALAVGAGETVQWTGHVVVLTTETITGGQDSGTDVTVTISGVEG